MLLFLVPPPPVWLKDWVQVLVIQLGAAVGIGIASWKWLTRPLRAKDSQIAQNLSRLTRRYKRDDFNFRSQIQTYIGKVDLQELTISRIEEALARIENKLEEDAKYNRNEFKEIRADISEIKERVASVESK